MAYRKFADILKEEREQVTVRLPPFGELIERWKEISGLLAKATQRVDGACEPIDLLRGAFAGQFGIWVCEGGGEIQAALVTEIKQYPRKRVVEVHFGGGNNLRLWVDKAVEAIDRHAREAGCECIVCIGRPGWARAWGAELTGDVVMVRKVSTDV